MASMATVQALLVPANPDEAAALVLLEGEWENVLAIVHANTVDPVELDDTTTMWVDGDGVLKGLPVNPRATRLATSYLPGFSRHTLLCGPAVVVGLDEDGTYRDVPEYVLDRFTALTAPPGETGYRLPSS